jgi:hypothetical protein
MPDFGFADHTFALLVAGRTIDEYAGLSMDHVSRLRALANELRAQTGVPVVVAPGGDLSRDVAPAEGPVYTRLALGVVVGAADADAGAPLGPLTLEDLRAGAHRAKQIPQAFWDAAARIVAEGDRLPFSPAQRRASAATTGHAALLEGIALDPDELRDGPDGLFLVASGRLPAADLVWGVLETPLTEEDEMADNEPNAEKGGPQLFLGQASGQEPHGQGVRGARVVHANYAGVGAALVDLDATARIAEASRITSGAFFLVPYYD